MKNSARSVSKDEAANLDAIVDWTRESEIMHFPNGEIDFIGTDGQRRRLDFTTGRLVPKDISRKISTIAQTNRFSQ